MNTISNTTNMNIKTNKDLKNSIDILLPNKELLESLQEIEDYKNGKIELDSYKDVKDLRKVLMND